MVLTGLLTLVTNCRGTDNRNDNPTGSGEVPPLRVVLPPAEATHLLTACDGTVSRADSLWNPSDSILASMDARVAIFAARRGEEMQRYSRQYVGIFRSGSRFILVNGIHERYLRRERELEEIPIEEAVEWFRTHAVRVCDGGSIAFRAEYDVAADSLVSFEFNEKS